MAGKYILALDQGTSSSRAVLFDEKFMIVASAQQEFSQIYPQSGWVEHAPEEIWQSVLATMREVVEKAGIAPRQIVGMGVTNQRETVVAWDRQTGTPVHNAIVWQDRRTQEQCQQLKREGHEADIQQKTGLVLDPYFSASKIAWILTHVPEARKLADNGQLAVGTVDSFLIWRLTDGASHVTELTNASRTMLCDINTGEWEAQLCALFDIPRHILPQIKRSQDDFGIMDAKYIGAAVPIWGVAGDQQAAAIGQGCFQSGMSKSTYGTGCFMLTNTGTTRIHSQNRLLSTVAYQLDDGVIHYALEGSIFIAGAAVQWLRDGLKLFDDYNQIDSLIQEDETTEEIFLVPAFVGLGAPWWEPHARGAVFGLTRNSGPADFTRAALRSVCYQTQDLLETITADWPQNKVFSLRVDGGMTRNGWLMQQLANITNTQIEVSANPETSVLGAAWLAGRQAGIAPSPQQWLESWQYADRYTPLLAAPLRKQMLDRWKDAVQRTLPGKQN